jgi:hypothetical protein
MPLTETDIKALRTNHSGDRVINDGAGLYLRIQKTGRRTWIWRTKRHGKTSYFTLGEWPEMTVKAARAALAKRTGKAVSPNALTVKAALEEWFTEQIEPKYRVSGNVRVYVRRACEHFGSMRLQEIEHAKAELIGFLRRYAKDSPVAGNRCLATLRLAFGWCVGVGYLDRNPLDGVSKQFAGGKEATARRHCCSGPFPLRRFRHGYSACRPTSTPKSLASRGRVSDRRIRAQADPCRGGRLTICAALSQRASETSASRRT